MGHRPILFLVRVTTEARTHLAYLQHREGADRIPWLVCRFAGRLERLDPDAGEPVRWPSPGLACLTCAKWAYVDRTPDQDLR